MEIREFGEGGKVKKKKKNTGAKDKNVTVRWNLCDQKKPGNALVLKRQ